jgi:preprotein translocase subunit SecB
MTDEAATPSTETPVDPKTSGGDDAAAGMTGPSIQVLSQFIRDLSFENPHAPQSMSQPEAPGIEVEVELAARGRDDGLFELDMTLTVAAKRGDQAAFHVQLVYGGVFAIQGVPQDALEPMLLIECPRFLFPFARQIIANVTTEGGFPAFRMEPLDFGAIYMARRAQELQQQPAAGNA